MARSRLHELSALGQAVWLDSLSREALETGELARTMREEAVVGVTSNPTIFEKALASGNWYDHAIARDVETDPKEIFLALAVRDVQRACDLLRNAWIHTGKRDGRVSIEVDPTLAHDVGATCAEVRRLFAWIDRPNLFVKIPATKAGLRAIEDSTAAGKSINVTLIFSLARYKEVVEAYLRGLERLYDAGGDPSKVESVASFFVSRVDTLADARLEKIGGDALALRGKLAVANAKLAYAHFEEIVASERWKRLAAQGARTQRCLWASTSTKNPIYRDVKYVEPLIGPDTVNTMPAETISAFQDHGLVAETLRDGLDEARETLDDIARVGVDYDDVTATLEEEGVQKFVDSFDELRERIRAKREGSAKGSLPTSAD
jgi:transaldolase